MIYDPKVKHSVAEFMEMFARSAADDTKIEKIIMKVPRKVFLQRAIIQSIGHRSKEKMIEQEIGWASQMDEINFDKD